VDAAQQLRDHRVMPSPRLVAFLVPSLVALAGCTSLLGDYTLGSGGGSDGGPGVDASLDGAADASGGDGSMGTTEGGGAGDSGGGAETSTGGKDGGPGPDGGPDSGGAITCALLGAEQRLVTGGDGGTISADNLFVYHAGQTNVVALAKSGGSAASTAYQIRTDHPGDPANVVTLGTPTSAGRLLSTARNVANNLTYALVTDQSDDMLLYSWPDGQNLSSQYASINLGAISIGSTKITPTSNGAFYAAALGNSGSVVGTYVDYESPAAPPSLSAGSPQISPLVDTGITDGQRTYRLSDDSVMVIYYAADSTMHQALFPSGSTTASTSRQFYMGNAQLLAFQPNGTNVEVSMAEPLDDAGMTFGLFTGSIPESQLMTFNPSTDIKPLTGMGGVSGTTQPCAVTYPGKLIVLFPRATGMDVDLIDTVHSSVVYQLTGSANLLPTDGLIVSCGIGVSAITANEQDFDLVWTENVGGGAQNLYYAPLRCTE
jgi:hypothetical protein